MQRQVFGLGQLYDAQKPETCFRIMPDQSLVVAQRIQAND